MIQSLTNLDSFNLVHNSLLIFYETFKYQMLVLKFIYIGSQFSIF